MRDFLDQGTLTHAAFSDNARLVDLVREQAIRRPAAIACRCAREQLSYNQLEQTSNQLARHLIAQGIQPGEHIGICLPKSSKVIVAILAVLKARAVYVPLDPDYPLPRLKFIASDAALRIVFISNSERQLFDYPTLNLDEVSNQLSDFSVEPITPTTSNTTQLALDPAYMIYTSGSTGQPKGVVVNHRAAVNFVQAMLRSPGFTSEDVLLSTSTLAFDISVYDVFVPLAAGGCIEILDRQHAKDARTLASSLASSRATLMFATPSSWRMLLEAGWQGDPARFRVFTGGEHLPRDLIAPLLARSREVWNFYGPTEATVLVTRQQITNADERILVGERIENTQLFIVDDKNQPVGCEESGELLIGGECLAVGYWNRPELNAERFVQFAGQRVYRTGDKCLFTADGRVECLGRLDEQVKVRGHRIELGEIEAVLATHPAIKQAAATVYQGANDGRLIGYVIPTNDAVLNIHELTELVARQLPDYMRPSVIVRLDAFPLTPNGKLDRKSLPTPPAVRPDLGFDLVPAVTHEQKSLVAIWQEVLEIDDIGITDNFFQLGGTSISAVKTLARIEQQLGWLITTPSFFDNATIQQLCELGTTATAAATAKSALTATEHSTNQAHKPSAVSLSRAEPANDAMADAIAIIGMSARFPGADNVHQYWQNLIDGVESIRFFQPDELDPSIPASVRGAENYVAARGVLDDAVCFDASFFGIAPREAELIDPQQRIMLELSYAALEDAGHVVRDPAIRVGIWAGCFANTYYTHNILSNPDIVAQTGEFQLATYTEKDFVASRVAHKLDLRGPAVNVNTACSTSLVAVIEACQSLLQGTCEIALAGGATVVFPQQRGHEFQAGNILTPDGHCRPFDHKAQGTLFSDGAGVVVLKRLSAAQRDGDQIYAVVRGFGLNNDGADKASFSAPSIRGQAEAIAMAHNMASVPADSIEYIEAHGTATPIGDPIEVAALAEVFRDRTNRQHFCALGSVKSNIGHTVAAAGVAGLIKTALSLHHEVIPATLHFEELNPAIPLADSPFFICDERREWPRRNSDCNSGAASHTRRAAVSSFGVGGTNAHVILEEAPAVPTARASSDDTATDAAICAGWPVQIWPYSVKHASVLDTATEQLASFAGTAVQYTSPTTIADIASTLQQRRAEYPHRAFAIIDNVDSGAETLRQSPRTRCGKQVAGRGTLPIAWMFPGQGSQYVCMTSQLYAHSPIFRHWLDTCCDQLEPLIGQDLRRVLYPAAGDEQTAEQILKSTRFTQPAIFAVSYALAQQWRAWGVEPDYLIGHSIGEFVAACLADVFSLADGLRLIAKRGEVIQGLPGGSMLTVRAQLDLVTECLPAGCQIAAVNSPTLCVVAGPTSAIMELAEQLASREIACRQLMTSHAFHSSMMDAAVEPFTQFVRQIPLNTPRTPIVSTVTGTWMTDLQAGDPTYWGRHLRETVQFSAAISHLLQTSDRPPQILLEIGPRATLTTLTKQHLSAEQKKALTVVPTLSDSAEQHVELVAMLHAVGSLWAAGFPIDWQRLGTTGPAKHMSLPTYPFQRKRYFVNARRADESPVTPSTVTPSPLPQPAVTSVTTRAVSASNSPISTSNRASMELLPGAEAATTHPQNSTFNRLQPHSSSPQTAFTTMADSHKRERQATITRVLFDVFENTSGIELAEFDSTLTFLEIGLDSLALTQAAAALKREFRLEVSFRQMLEQTPSPESLVAWLCDTLPQDHYAPAASEITTDVPTEGITCSPSPSDSTTISEINTSLPATAVPLEPPNAASLASCAPASFVPGFTTPNLREPTSQSTVGAPSSSVEAIVQQQLQLMQQQLWILSGHAPVPSVATAGTVTHTHANPSVSHAVPATIAANTGSTALVQPIMLNSGNERLSPSEQEPPQKVFGAQARVTLDVAPVDETLQSRLQQFIRDYTAHTPKSKAYAQQHRRYLADPRAVTGFQPLLKEMTYPIVVQRSQGAHLWDIDGHQYIDMLCGFGSNFFGHSPDFMVKALSEQLTTGYEIGPQSTLTGEVAQMFCEMTGNERVAFCNTGSEAVLGALRLARTVTGRDKVVMFTGDYHGILDEVIVRSNKKLATFPAASGIPKQSVQSMVVLEYGSDEALEYIEREIDNLAAIIVESVQSRRPEYQPREFLQRLRELTADQPTALVFDEVITGFRVGLRGAQAFYGIEADLATYGKVIGGGMPIGVIAGKARYMDALDGGFWQFGDDSKPEVGMTYFAGTFVRHPLALAAAKQTLLQLKARGPEIYAQLNRLSDRLDREMNAVIVETGIPLAVGRFFSLFKPMFTSELPYADLLFAAMRRRGIHIWEHRPCFLTTAHTDAHIDAFLQAFREAITETQAMGFLPERPRTIASPAATEAPANAKVGKDRSGKPAWFVPDTANPGQFIQIPGQPSAL